ncbi:ent-kaurene oxidase [Fusarium beomiforme]|uniref:Ent-kaurene oxidase n=1 Tax=Fusarium beomiforme TaxID=44412 RepID=A0A9P5DSL8_9HYPO|nr:ent-kaurene oxidase [Fusarium beomiforme]
MDTKLPFQQTTATIYNDNKWPSIVAAGVVALTSVLVVALRFWNTSQTPKVKILLKDEIKSARQRALEYCFNPRAVMAKGYAKVFGLDTQDGVKIVIPPRFLDELKSHPALSFKVSIDNDMQIEYTHFGGPAEYVIHAIKANLTGSLSAFTPLLHRMVQKNMPKILGKYNHWTPVKVHDRVLRLITTNNARVFQGTAASLDEEWLEASTGYVLACFDCIRALKQWHPWLRPLVYRFIPERAAIKDQWTKGRKRVMASMQERQAKGGNLEDPPTMLDHLSNGKNEPIANDIELQLLHQMTLIAVGTVTTFSSTTQAIYDLVAHPEYIPILREEVESVPRDQNGNFTKESTIAMDKLDSFLKESQRFNSPDLTTFQRAAIADMTLPDGTFVPKGTKLEINTCSIHKDHELYESPEEFDGLRFHKWRKAPGKKKKYMYSSSGIDDLSWGFGRHACPGRYLSAINIKLIMAELLLNYDIKLPDGVSRPANIEFEVLCSPDPDFEILLKNREH